MLFFSEFCNRHMRFHPARATPAPAASEYRPFRSAWVLCRRQNAGTHLHAALSVCGKLAQPCPLADTSTDPPPALIVLSATSGLINEQKNGRYHGGSTHPRAFSRSVRALRCCLRPYRKPSLPRDQKYLAGQQGNAAGVLQVVVYLQGFAS